MTQKPKYNSLQEWKDSEPVAYNVAFCNNWIDDICKKFGWSKSTKKNKFKLGFRKFFSKKQQESILTTKIDLKQKCLKEASKHKTPWDWQKASPETYQTALDNDWFSECCKAMKSL